MDRTEKAEKTITEQQAAQAPEAEEVTASDIVVGDKIFIPNSRHAQAVDMVVTTVQNEESIRIFTVGEATWTVKANHTVRRVIA